MAAGDLVSVLVKTWNAVDRWPEELVLVLISL